MNYNKLQIIISEKKIRIDDIAEKIGMTRQGLLKSIKDESLKISTLEKICEVLEVSISTFFDENNAKIIQYQNGNGNKQAVNMSDSEKENLYLKELLAEKERTIQILLDKNK